MIIVDKALKKREAEGNPVKFGMFGAGFMGKGLIHQVINYTPGMDVPAVCNRSLDRAAKAYRDAGVTDITEVTTANELDKVVASGGHAITSNPEALYDCETLDTVLEGTGHVEYGAQVTMGALENRKNVVLLNAEVDGTVGPLLKKKADDLGVVVSGADGDQPGVQLNLFRFVQQIGLKPLVCGNIKGLQDPYRNPTTQEGFAKKWGQTPSMVTSFADGSKISFEQAIVANATDMSVSERGMIGQDFTGHVDELTTMYDIDMLREHGGIVDYVVGAQPSPGVYVIAEAQDDLQKHYLNLGKLGPGPLYSFYVPYHLITFEFALSVARVALFQDAATEPLDGPKVDVVAVAKKDLKAGETVDGIGHYMTYGECENYNTTISDRLLPIGVAEGCVLNKDIAKDTVLTYDDVELPEGQLIQSLRAEQNALFPVS